MTRLAHWTAVPLIVGFAACTAADARTVRTAALDETTPPLTVAVDSLIPATVEASGLAAPILQATLSTRLIGEVTAVTVHEGDQVRAGQVLVRLDVRDLDARADQADAGLSSAHAQVAEAELYAARIRALYADSAAPKALLDAAETGLARAQAGFHVAEGAQRELAAVARYGELRAPFDGVVVRRLVDPGSFAAPGGPLLTIEAGSRLRVSVTTTPALARLLRRGDAVEARIEDVEAVATVEGVVPAPGGGMYTINAVVENHEDRYASGGAASLLLPTGSRRVVLVPRSAIARQGDLAGVRVWQGYQAELRWVRLGAPRGDLVEVLSGLSAGERIVDLRTTGRN